MCIIHTDTYRLCTFKHYDIIIESNKNYNDEF